MSWGKILKQCYLYAAKQTGESVQNFPVVPMTRGACENSCASKGYRGSWRRKTNAQVFLNERKGKWGSSQRTFLTPASSCQSKANMNTKDLLFSEQRQTSICTRTSTGGASATFALRGSSRAKLR